MIDLFSNVVYTISVISKDSDVWLPFVLFFYCCAQLLKDDIMAKQSSLDKVVKKAQALLKASADAHTSHGVTQLTNKYNGVVSLAKVRNINI